MADVTKAVLIVVVLAATWSDLRTRRIPNWLTVSGAALGFVLQTWYGGLSGAFAALSGAVLAFGLFIVLYIAGGMGAGDVKLFTAVGALTGPQAVVIVFVFTGLLGGVAALALAASHGRLRETLENTGALLMHFGRLRWQEVRAATVAAGPRALRLPYGAVIAAGTLMALAVLN